MIAPTQRRFNLPPQDSPSQLSTQAEAALRLANDLHRFRACTLPPGSPLADRLQPAVDAIGAVVRELIRGK